MGKNCQPLGRNLFSYSKKMSKSKWFFGTYIKRLLDSKGMTAAELASKSKISPSQISWILNGERSDKLNPPKMSFDMIIDLSEALNIEINKLRLAYRGFDPDKVEPKDLDKASDLVNDILRLIDKHQGGSL